MPSQTADVLAPGVFTSFISAPAKVHNVELVETSVGKLV